MSENNLEAKENLLSKSSIQFWLDSLEVKGISSIVSGMESHEVWTSDVNHIAIGLRKVANKLAFDPNYKSVDPSNYKTIDTLIYLLSHMPASQAFRFINLAHKHQPNISEVLTERAQYHCENKTVFNAESRVMIDRVLVLIRSRCFSLIFGRQRRRLILEILSEK
jgi:hypothetical protein